jgi:hypothetical protein
VSLGDHASLGRVHDAHRMQRIALLRLPGLLGMLIAPARRASLPEYRDRNALRRAGGH